MNYLYICFRLFRINSDGYLEELERVPCYSAPRDQESD